MISIEKNRERRGREPLDLDSGLTILILRLIKKGWETVCKDALIQGDLEEREMTEFLLQGMRSHLDSYPSSAEAEGVEGRDNITVARGTEVPPRAGHRGVSGIPDISVYFHDIRVRNNDHDPHALIECKRVSGSRAKLCQLYVVDGMDRFASGKYGADHSVGFMIGFLLQGSVPLAVECINGHVRSKLGPCEVLVPSDWQCSHAVHVSRHARPTLSSPVVVYHTFLRVSSSR